MEQFRKEGVLGCPHDYDVLEGALIPLIEKAHDGGTTHCGKIPSNTSHDTKAQMELLELRRQLEKAVKDEDYELAAKLRDKLLKLREAPILTTADSAAPAKRKQKPTSNRNKLPGKNQSTRRKN